MQTHSSLQQEENTTPTALQQRLLRWIQQLKSDDLDLLNETVQQLLQYPEAALPLLLDALLGAEEEIRKNAAWVLGFIRHTDALTPLFQVMSTDASVDVRLGASWALRQFELKQLAEVVFVKLEPPQNLQDIANYLSSKSWKARWYCTIYLTFQYQPDLLEVLLRVARDDENVLVRCSAILTLAGYNSPEVSSHLRAFLQDINDYVKIEASTVISLKNDRSALPELGKQLQAYNENVRVAAIAAIGALAQEPAEILPFLAQALKDPAAMVRINAAMALNDIAQRYRKHHQNLSDLCLKALRDENVYVVKNATRALGFVGDEDALRQIILLLKQEARPPIVANLVQALGMFQDPRALKTLSRFLKHPSWEVRFEVIRALSLLTTQRKQVYPLLLQALKDPAVMVKEQAVRALGALGNPKAVPVLEKLKLQHPYGAINKSIGLALDKLLGI